MPAGSPRRRRPGGRSRSVRAPRWSSRPGAWRRRSPRPHFPRPRPRCPRPRSRSRRAGPGGASPRPGTRAAPPGCPPPVHGGATGDETIREEPPQRRRVCVRVGPGHRRASGRAARSPGRGRWRLVLAGLEQVDGTPSSGSTFQASSPLSMNVRSAPSASRREEGVMASPARVRPARRRPRRARLPAPGSRRTARRSAAGPRASGPEGGRRTAGRRASSRTAGSSRGRRPSRSPRARRWVGWLQVRSLAAMLAAAPGVRPAPLSAAEASADAVAHVHRAGRPDRRPDPRPHRARRERIADGRVRLRLREHQPADRPVLEHQRTAQSPGSTSARSSRMSRVTRFVP